MNAQEWFESLDGSDTWPEQVRKVLAQHRKEVLADADAYLTRLGYGDSAYLLRSTDVPVQG